jgi:phage repressor protein C with HTH and peptisase S24 domain
MTVRLDDENIVERAAAHPQHAGVTGGFYVYIVGNAMSPRYEEGERAAVHPGRMPRPGEDCLLVFKDNTCQVRRYRGRDDTRFITERLSPVTEERWHHEDVKSLMAVIGRS